MEQPSHDTVGIVLAGGGSTRLASVAVAGGGKASFMFQGRTFLEHVIAAVATEVDDMIVVAAPGQPLPAGSTSSCSKPPERFPRWTARR